MRSLSGDQSIALTARDGGRVARSLLHTERDGLNDYNSSPPAILPKEVPGVAVWAVEVIPPGVGQYPVSGLVRGRMKWVKAEDVAFWSPSWAYATEPEDANNDGNPDDPDWFDCWVMEEGDQSYEPGDFLPLCLLVSEFLAKPVFVSCCLIRGAGSGSGSGSGSGESGSGGSGSGDPVSGESGVVSGESGTDSGSGVESGSSGSGGSGSGSGSGDDCTDTMTFIASHYCVGDCVFFVYRTVRFVDGRFCTVSEWTVSEQCGAGSCGSIQGSVIGSQDDVDPPEPCCEGQKLPKVLWVDFGSQGRFQAIYDPIDNTWYTGLFYLPGCGYCALAFACSASGLTAGNDIRPDIVARVNCLFVFDPDAITSSCESPYFTAANVLLSGPNCGCEGTTLSFQVTSGGR